MVTAAATPRKKKKYGLRYQYAKNKYLFALLIPGLLYYALFHYGPLYGLQIAFKNYVFSLGIWGSHWVGLENFRDMFVMRSFREVFRNTLLISFYKLVTGFPAPIFFAILLNELMNRPYRKVVQTISYLPHFISWVVLGGLFVQFLSPTTGPINILLKAMGIKPIYFLGSARWFRSVLVLTSIWKGIGWGSIVYLAALSNVDPQLHEAAIIDGANRFQSIMHVTIPALTPVITIMLILATGSLVSDDFDQIFNLYNPAVYKVADVLGTYTYRVGLVEFKYSFSTAVGLFRNVLSFSLVALTNVIAKRINEYGLW